MPYDEDKNWIIAECARAGCRITDRQLADWHRDGLIREPRKIGLGRGLGSASLYPMTTIGQVIECAKLLKNKSVNAAGWILWLKGYPVDDRFWREPFAHAICILIRVRVWATNMSDVEPAFPELKDEADAILSEIVLAPKVSGWLGFARRVLKSALVDLAASALSVAIGAFEKCGTSEKEDRLGSSISRLIGTQAAAKKKRHVQPLILEFDGATVADHMSLMSAAFRNPKFQLTKEITKDEAEKIRNEFLFLLRAFDGIRQSDPKYLGRAGDLLTKVLNMSSPKIGAMAFVIWMFAREVPGWREGIYDLRNKINEHLKNLAEEPVHPFEGDSHISVTC